MFVSVLLLVLVAETIQHCLSLSSRLLALSCVTESSFRLRVKIGARSTSLSWDSRVFSTTGLDIIDFASVNYRSLMVFSWFEKFNEFLNPSSVFLREGAPFCSNTT